MQAVHYEMPGEGVIKSEIFTHLYMLYSPCTQSMALNSRSQ